MTSKVRYLRVGKAEIAYVPRYGEGSSRAALSKVEEESSGAEETTPEGYRASRASHGVLGTARDGPGLLYRLRGSGRGCLAPE